MNANGTNLHRVVLNDRFHRWHAELRSRRRARTLQPMQRSARSLRHLPDQCRWQRTYADYAFCGQPGDDKAVYSPDGTKSPSMRRARRLFLSVSSDERRRSDIMLVTPTRLGADAANWSPDGRRLAFQAYFHYDSGRTKRFGAATRVAAISSDLTKNNFPGQRSYFAQPHDFNPSWSPRGDAIVFEHWNGSFTSWGIYVLRQHGAADGAASAGARRLPGPRTIADSGRPFGARRRAPRCGSSKVAVELPRLGHRPRYPTLPTLTREGVYYERNFDASLELVVRHFSSRSQSVPRARRSQPDNLAKTARSLSSRAPAELAALPHRSGRQPL